MTINCCRLRTFTEATSGSEGGVRKVMHLAAEDWPGRNDSVKPRVVALATNNFDLADQEFGHCKGITELEMYLAKLTQTTARCQGYPTPSGGVAVIHAHPQPIASDPLHAKAWVF